MITCGSDNWKLFYTCRIECALFRNGLRDGEGSFLGSDFSYSGNYSEDFREGFGVLSKCLSYIPSACDIYRGYWHLDKKHGYGNLTFANGDLFVGTFKEDQQDGHGVFTAANGTIYTGSWQERHFCRES